MNRTCKNSGVTSDDEQIWVPFFLRKQLPDPTTREIGARHVIRVSGMTPMPATALQHFGSDMTPEKERMIGVRIKLSDFLPTHCDVFFEIRIVNDCKTWRYIGNLELPIME